VPKTKSANISNRHTCYFCSYLFLKNDFMVTNTSGKSAQIRMNNSDVILDVPHSLQCGKENNL
jgi:hypothetical protein